MNEFLAWIDYGLTDLEFAGLCAIAVLALMVFTNKEGVSDFKEFWIHWPPFTKDPLGQVFNIKRMVQNYASEDCVHVIEYDALIKERARSRRLREALEFYASLTKEIKIPVKGTILYEYKTVFDPVGETAREALKDGGEE